MIAFRSVLSRVSARRGAARRARWQAVATETTLGDVRRGLEPRHRGVAPWRCPAGSSIVAVGEYGNVVLSDDDGKTWRQAKSVPTQVTFTAVAFVDDKNGWAVGHDTVILHTSDAGETWPRNSAAAKRQRLVTVTRSGEECSAAATSVTVRRGSSRVPEVGDLAPEIHTPTLASVGGDVEADRHARPARRHARRRLRRRGRQEARRAPVRDAGPVSDPRLRPGRRRRRRSAGDRHGDKVAFIHNEVYIDNDPSRAASAVRAFGLPSEPWLFAIGSTAGSDLRRSWRARSGSTSSVRRSRRRSGARSIRALERSTVSEPHQPLVPRGRRLVQPRARRAQRAGAQRGSAPRARPSAGARSTSPASPSAARCLATAWRVIGSAGRQRRHRRRAVAQQRLDDAAARAGRRARRRRGRRRRSSGAPARSAPPARPAGRPARDSVDDHARAGRRGDDEELHARRRLVAAPPPPHQPVRLVGDLDVDLALRRRPRASARGPPRWRAPPRPPRASPRSRSRGACAWRPPLTTKWLLWSLDNRQLSKG